MYYKYFKYNVSKISDKGNKTFTFVIMLMYIKRSTHKMLLKYLKYTTINTLDWNKRAERVTNKREMRSTKSPQWKRVKNSSTPIKKRMIEIWNRQHIPIGANKKAGNALNLGD